MREHVRHVHFVGIGGAGMNGIADVLLNQGYSVSGSDLVESTATRRLRELGATVYIGHSEDHVTGSDVVVTSSAVRPDNPELRRAQAERIPVIPRAEMLGELMRFAKGIAVAGTHGKTTTTSLVTAVLARAGLDPTFVIGGVVNSARSSARLGRGEYLVAEADESDGSFLHLQPLIAVVTNIDLDHMGFYEGDYSRLKRSFAEFLLNLPFYGLAVLCVDDPGVRDILPEVRKPVLTYGTDAGAQVRACNIRQHGARMHFDVLREGVDGVLAVELALPGHHNVLNALAAVAVAGKLGVADEHIAAALRDFEGIGRRFQSRGEIRLGTHTVLLIDDYAHHPRELDATLRAAAGCWPRRRLVPVFQPHRYSRTRELMDDFSAVLAEQDPLVITEVYAAGEDPLPGADGRALCRSIRARGRVDPIFVEALPELPRVLEGIVHEGDVVLTLGAGDIGRASQGLAQRYGTAPEAG